ncbi:hypothetical protein GGTG_01674 [Gaeumannomyces tritici R3-111a-1]|uniref:Secreted protein n=1 Tax=Gaeumannomyces tritici (strain R3-111a-1) TaxID=644352 RepID=J3NK93_GAET3|nr:hypothetical protein GGTG_01674 [Gaeumannomyces tritici R3-111a-1]EJT81697.1 hypothetical protein GGTG_01674 [Gaeumannomyces tritici R3-111a-1]
MALVQTVSAGGGLKSVQWLFLRLILGIMSPGATQQPAGHENHSQLAFICPRASHPKDKQLKTKEVPAVWTYNTCESSLQEKHFVCVAVRGCSLRGKVYPLKYC